MQVICFKLLYTSYVEKVLRERMLHMKLWQSYIAIIVTFFGSQFLGLPIQKFLLERMGGDLTNIEIVSQVISYSLLFTNTLAAVLIFLIIRKTPGFWDVFKGEKMSFPLLLLWGFIGFVLAIVGQIFARFIEHYIFGIELGSENTEMISMIAKASPIMIISVVFFAPLLEEILFRRVLFGGLYKVSNFWVGAIASGLAFAAAHREFDHLIVYLMPAFAFAFVYYVTKSIWAPMISHFLMNGMLIVARAFVDPDELQKMLEQAPQWIYWLFI